MPKIESVDDVVAYQLCSGCGACAAVAPKRYRMIDQVDYGRRPITIGESSGADDRALSVCPGIELKKPKPSSTHPEAQAHFRDWGPVLEVVEAHSAIESVRYEGSSGGVATAIGAYCIEKAGYEGVQHTGSSAVDPLVNEIKFSKTIDSLLQNASSRYSPASPCEDISRLTIGSQPKVFIGKPCDVAGLEKIRNLESERFDAPVLKIAFFCAGTPSTRGLRDFLAHKTVPISRIQKLRFRGRGWPGLWQAQFLNSNGAVSESVATYAESWSFLQSYRQWRCYICPDHSGEYSDISVGDPWYREPSEGANGSSLVVLRSEFGRKLFYEAVQAGYIVVTSEDPEMIDNSQPGLRKVKSELFGRLCALRIAGAAVPKYEGFDLFSSWKELALSQQFRSFIATFRRILRRKLRHRVVRSDEDHR